MKKRNFYLRFCLVFLLGKRENEAIEGRLKKGLREKCEKFVKDLVINTGKNFSWREVEFMILSLQ